MAMRRKRATTAARLADALCERESKGAPVKSANGRAVTCSRHEEREHPVLLSAALKDEFQPNALLRAVSNRQPELRFYVRAHAESFSDAVRGISILRAVAEGARITDKELELVAVSEEEATLDEVVMVLLDRYLSKRDIWHMHLTMMQDAGAMIYSSYEQNFAHHIPSSRIESMRFAGSQGGAPAQSGRVSPDTRVVFKSGSINLFVLIQVSSELLAFGLSGRPYWEVLLECLGQLVDRSIRVTNIDANGHYVRVVLFARARKDTTTGFEDFYEVAWEGLARALPSTTQLLARLRWVCLQLHESAEAAARGRAAGGGWNGIVAGDLEEASRGNLLECLNLCLDHLDLHYLDRSLRVTGQKLVALTAGCGLIHAASRKLYELTHRRFSSAGPSSEKAFHLVSVRQPPLHKVPWVLWPDGPSPCAAERPGTAHGVPPACPPWMDLSFYSEVDYCPCPPAMHRPRSSLLPLESLASFSGQCQAAGDSAAPARRAAQPRLHVPQWCQASCHLRVPVGGQQHSQWRGGQWPPVGVPKQTGPELINELRAPELRSYLRKVEENGSDRHHRPRYSNTYSVEPSRFDYADIQSEKINTMYDLVGCRLEARTSELCYQSDQGKVAPGSHWLEALPRSPTSPSAVKDTVPRAAYMQGQLIPGALHRCTVRAGDGLIEWKMEPRDNGLMVNFIDNTNDDKSDVDLTFPYACSVRMQFHRHDLSDRGEAAWRADEESGEEELRGPRWDGAFGWMRVKRIFHMPMRPDWNKLDSIIAGDLEMPAALPYPVDPSCSDPNDRCPGWQLRSAIKQHLYVLMPCREEEHSHAGVLEGAMSHLGGRMDTGVDPFGTLEEGAGASSETWARAGEQRQHLIDRFREFTSRLEHLCFEKVNARSGAQLGAAAAGSLGISLVADGAASGFTVKRMSRTIYIRDTSMGFPQSRDWFELFYDSQYSPPKLFVFAIQWMVCSSVHLVKFCQTLARIAEENGFILLRTPIGQLFPQPAPYFVWSEERETNFDRLAFHAPRRLVIPCLEDDARASLNARLLECWTKPPLGFVFVFSSAQHDFKVEVTKAIGVVTSTRAQSGQLFQRLKGWMLCHCEGLCVVTLREKHVFWFENRLALTDARDLRMSQERLRRLDELWRVFKRCTAGIVREYTELLGDDSASEA